MKENGLRKLYHETASDPKKYEQAAEYVLSYNPESNEEKNAILILEGLKEQGFETYFVGGCVRDMALGKKPKDFDMATSGSPAQVIDWATKNNYGIDSSGAQYGMVRVVHEGIGYEVTTFRVDGEYTDGRRPDSVAFVDSAYQDATRRDFTCNALYFDPTERRLIDFFGGMDDLRQKRLRFVGEIERIDTDQYGVACERIQDDPLRMIRAVRFANGLDMDIDPEALRAIKENTNLLQYDEKVKKKVAWERRGDELLKMLVNKNIDKAFVMMAEIDLLQYVLPEVDRLRGVDQGNKHHQEGDVFDHVTLGLQKIPEVVEKMNLGEDEYITKKILQTLSLAWLAHDIAKPDTRSEGENGDVHFFGHEKVGATRVKQMFERFNVKSETILRLQWLVANHMRVSAIPSMKKNKQQDFFIQPDFPLLLALHRIDCEASLPIHMESYETIKSLYEQAVAEGLLDRVKLTQEKNVCDGHKLRALGFKGAEIGIIKKVLETKVLTTGMRDYTPEVGLQLIQENKEHIKTFLQSLSPADLSDTSKRDEITDRLGSHLGWWG